MRESESEYGARACNRLDGGEAIQSYRSLSLVATAWVFPYLLHAQEAVTQLKLNSILDSLERTGEQNRALSQSYEVNREYKVFRSDDPKPMSDVTAQVSFTPPDTKTFKITDAQGSSTGKRIVSVILEHEIASRIVKKSCVGLNSSKVNLTVSGFRRALD